MIGLVFKYFDLAVSAYPNNKRSHFILAAMDQRRLSAFGKI